jgi:hypothetical protein
MAQLIAIDRDHPDLPLDQLDRSMELQSITKTRDC